MALKSDRYELQTDISFFTMKPPQLVAAQLVMEQQLVLVLLWIRVLLFAKDKTAVPLGILLNDVVDKDLTRTHLNQHKDEVQKGGKVTILRKGYVVTNNVTNVADVDAGEVAYRCDDVDGNVASSGTVAVGRFLSAKDADNYVKVEVNLP